MIGIVNFLSLHVEMLALLIFSHGDYVNFYVEILTLYVNMWKC